MEGSLMSWNIEREKFVALSAAPYLTIRMEVPNQMTINTTSQSQCHIATGVFQRYLRSCQDAQALGPFFVDLIITDLSMPEMDGLDTISELTKSFWNVKILAMTGGADLESRLATARLLGARATLQKPFELDTLLSVVKSELEQ